MVPRRDENNPLHELTSHCGSSGRGQPRTVLVVSGCVLDESLLVSPSQETSELQLEAKDLSLDHV